MARECRVVAGAPPPQYSPDLQAYKAKNAQKARWPRRDIPRAMVLTLVVSTVLYVMVGAVAVVRSFVDRLASSSAPLSLVFREIAGVSPQTN